MLIQLLVLTCWFSLGRTTHFYGQELSADMKADATNVYITIYWRLVWLTGRAPNAESLSTCYSSSPCPSGPTSFPMTTGAGGCHDAVSSPAANYDVWTGTSTGDYFPLSSVPPPVSTLNMAWSGGTSWGLLQYSSSTAFGGMLTMMTSRRADNNGFDSTARSPIAPIVELQPGCGGWSFTIPVMDPDGDPTGCRWGNSVDECQGACYSTYTGGVPFTLTSDCVVTYTGLLVASNIAYPISVQLLDFYPNDPTTQMSSVPLQFLVVIEPNSSPCVALSPLVTDSCSKALAPMPPTCSGSPTVSVSNAVAPVTYNNTVNSSVSHTCLTGYASSSTGETTVIASCIANSSASNGGSWEANGSCNCMNTFI